MNPSKKAAHRPFGGVRSIDEIRTYLGAAKLNLIQTCEIHYTDAPSENTCFRGGILMDLHTYSLNNFLTSLPEKLKTSQDHSKLFKNMKESNTITYRQYLFASGLTYSYEQMAKTKRFISSDEVAKTMFMHLIDLIKPTCTDIRIDVSGPGAINQQVDNEDEFILTGRLELAYSVFSAVYNYSLVLTIEMKSELINISPYSTHQQELQILSEMAYCLKASKREHVLGILFHCGFITGYVFDKSQQDRDAYYAKLEINENLINSMFAVGNELEQLLYHCLHSTLNVELSNKKFTITTTWKACELNQALYVKDRLVTEAD